MPLTTAQVQQAYVTFFSRAADTAGLNYWTSLSSLSLSDLYSAFSGAAEYTSAFSGLSNGARVNLVYNNLFGRDADLSGLNYWTLKLDQGAISLSNLALALGAGAQGTDATTLANRVTAATAYTNQLDTGPEILGYSGATAIAAVKTWLSGITDAASLAAATAPAALASTVASTTSAVGTVVGSTFVLTTSVDSVSGGANNDTITGTLGSSGTFNVGDNINGGSGTDTLNLIAASSTDGAAGLVSLDGVEVVNIRQLGTAAQALTVNAADWSGVAKLTNASSLEGSLLQVSGSTAGMNFAVYGDTDLNVDFAGLTSGDETASITLVNAGSGSASTALSRASVDFDLDGSGLLDAVSINLSGSTYVHVEGGDELRSITLSGSATHLNLSTTATELLSTLDASQLNGTNRFFLSGRSDINVIGGAGADTFEFGTALSNADAVNGGSGADQINATLGGALVRVNATAVEASTVSFDDVAGGEYDLSGAQSIASLSIIDTTGSAVATITNFAGGTANILTSALDSITIDTVANANLVANVGSASGEVSISGMYVTDASNVDIQATGSGTHTISLLSVDNDAKTLDVIAAGSSNLVLTLLAASGATAVSVTTNASGSITLTSGFEAVTALTTVTLRAGGSETADINAEDAELFSSGRTGQIDLDVVTLSAASGADIFVSGMQLGTGGANDGGGYSASGTNNNAVIVNFNAGNASVIAASAGAGASGIDIEGSGVTLTVNAIAAQSGQIYLGQIQMDDAATVSATGVASLAISASVAQDAILNITDVSGSDVVMSVGNVTVGASGGYFFASAGLDAGNKTFTMGAVTIDGGSATFGAMSASAIGAISVVANTGGTATFGNIYSSAIGQITITLGGNGAGVDFAQLGTANANARVSGIEVNALADGSADFGAFVGTGGAIGAITINVAASASVDFDTIDASAIGVITVSGAGWVDFGVVSASGRVAGIDLRGLASGGSFTIDLSGVTQSVTVDGGSGAMTITQSTDANDEFNLQTGEGTDTIRYNDVAANKDTIIRFEAGTADDQIEINVGSGNIAIVNGNMAGISGGAAVSLVSQSAGTGFTMASANNLIVLTTAYATTSNMIADLASGSGKLTLGSGVMDSGSLLTIIWTDGSDSYVSVATNLSTGGTTMASGSLTVSDATLATLQGVTPGALVAANFEFV